MTYLVFYANLGQVADLRTLWPVLGTHSQMKMKRVL